MKFSIDQLDENLLLEQWRWLCAEPVTLVARNGFGDLFLRTVESKVLWLDVHGGTLVEVAESESSFEDSLRQTAKCEHWLAEQQLERFAERGLKPNDLQCIGFKMPVVFAESVNVPNNAYVADLYEQVSFLGDLHRADCRQSRWRKGQAHCRFAARQAVVDVISRLRSMTSGQNVKSPDNVNIVHFPDTSSKRQSSEGKKRHV